MNDNVSSITESTLDWFESMGYKTAFAPDITPHPTPRPSQPQPDSIGG